MRIPTKKTAVGGRVSRLIVILLGKEASIMLDGCQLPLGVDLAFLERSGGGSFETSGERSRGEMLRGLPRLLPCQPLAEGMHLLPRQV